MNFTFGIATDCTNVPLLNKVIESIKTLAIPNVEIILMSGYEVIPTIKHTTTIVCDGWLPKKKNLLAKCAQYENLVVLHDYYLFDKDWYKSFLEFGDMWDICSNPQFLINRKRHFTDWVIWDSPIYPRYHSLAYDDWGQTRYQYISGGYFLVKRRFLRENPINEEMPQGSPEDVEWSLRVRDKALIKCNPTAIVRHGKVHRDAK